VGRALRIGAGVALAFLVLTCSDEQVSGPKQPGALPLDLRALAAPAAPGEPDIPIDSIRVTLQRPAESGYAYNVTLRVRGDTLGDSLYLKLDLPLNQSPEDFILDVQVFGGGIVWYRLTDTLTISSGDNTPPPLTARYVGPGTNAARVQMLPADTTAVGGASFALHAVVYDSSNSPIIGVPVGYRLSDPSRGSVSVSFLTASFTGASNVRDSVWVIAETPTHLRDSTRIHILPPAATLQKISGDSQNGPVNVLLPAPLVVRVLDALGVGYQGRAVTWSVISGTATLSAASTPSDTGGYASVTLTPTGAGPLTVQAAASGLAGSPVSFTVGAASGAIAQVILDRTLDTIPVGADLQYTATLKDSAGNTVSGVVTWTSASPPVASITSSGLAHGVAGGQTSIIAAAGGHADTATLLVDGLATIAVSPADTVITAIGDSLLLRAAALSTFGDTITSGIVIRFTSATPTVATVNAVTGRVRLIGAGNAVVLARDTVSGEQGSATLRVNQVTVGIQNTPTLPDSLQVGVNGLGQIVAKALDRNGFPIPGKTFGFSSRVPTIASVGSTGLVTGLALGRTYVADSVDGFKDSVLVAVVVAPPPLIQWAFDSISVGNGSNVSIALSLSRTEASPLIVKLVSSDTTVAKTTVKTVTFSPNTVNTSVVIQGLAPGRVTLTASDSSGLGFQSDSMVVTVVSTIEFRDIGQFFQRTNFYVNQNETYRAQVFLSDPAPAGGLGVTFVYKTGGAVVTPAPAIIPAGQLAADIVIAGLATGRDSIVPTSGGFVGKYSYVDVAANDLTINLPFPYNGVLGVGQSFQPYVGITYGMDHPLVVSSTLAPALGTLPGLDTIPTNTNYRYFTVGATALGQTLLTVSAPGWNSDNATLTFTTPALSASGPGSMIAGNPTKSSWSVSTVDSLGYAHVVTDTVVVTATSLDPTIVAVDVATGKVPPGSSSVGVGAALRALPGAGGDSTFIVVSAPGYRPDTFLVRVTPPNLAFNYGFPDGRVGLGMRRVNAAYVAIPYVRPDTFWVIFTHTRAGVIGRTNPDSVAIPAGQTFSYIDIQGDTLGVDTVTITAPGYVVTGSPAVFTVDPIHVRPNSVSTPLYTISAPRPVTAHVVDSANNYSYPLLAPLTVTLTSGNAQTFTLDSGRVTIPAGATSSNVDTLRVVGVDTVGTRVFSSAPGSSPDSSNLIRVLPTPLTFALGFPYSVGRGLKLQFNRVYVQGGNAPDTVRVAITHALGAGVDSVIPDTVVIPTGQQFSGYFEILGLDSLGTDTLIASAPGFVDDRIAVDPEAVSLVLSNPGTSHQTTDAPSLVSVSTTTRIGYAQKPISPVTVTMASTDPSVLKIDSAGVVLPAGDTGTSVVDTSLSYAYFRIRYVGSGTARVITTAPGFKPDTSLPISVTGPTLRLGYATISLGQGQVFTSQYVYVDNAITGQPLVVHLAKSDSTLPPASQVFTLSADSVVIPVGFTFSPQFDITGQVINSALLIARASGYSQASATVQVTQPRLVASPATLNLPVGGVPSTVFVYTTDATGNQHVVVAALTVDQVESDATVVQGDSANRVIATGTSSTTFRFSGLKKGSAQVVFSAPGYTPDTIVVQVDSGQLQIINAPQALGPNQVSEFQTYVQLNYTTETDVTVNLSSDNPGVLQVTPSVVIPAGSYYAYFDITGVAIGTATISATSLDAKPATPVLVRVSTPKLILSVPTSVVAGTTYGVTVITGDSLGTLRTVTSTVTVSLASNVPSKVAFDSTPIHVDSGSYFATSGVRFDSAGTYLVIASAPGYTGDTVTVNVGGAFVLIADDFFLPDTVTIPAGNYVTWFNAGQSQHTSTEDSATPVWNSGLINPGNTYQRFFNTVGTFNYHCTVHGVAMSGTVIVTP
jgi:plastocyanin